MQYIELIQKLFSINRFSGIKLGLQNSIRLNELLGFPTNAFESIHIAGTNGKGTVTKKIATALESAGYRVGLYTSPHLSCFRERIQINGKMITENEVMELLSSIFDVAEKEKISATFFELTTLLAFFYFSKNAVDVAVLETGLGGRLDSTNIVVPKLSVITSVSLEHTDILGSTIEEIAYEKAGIIKEGVPVVLGPRLPMQLFEGMAKERNSPCIVVNGSYKTFDEENTAIAKTALEFLRTPSKDIQIGLKSYLPCRLEVIAKSIDNPNFPLFVILDVAHNPDGMLHLFKAIRERFPKQPLRVLCGLSKTKDIIGCLKVLKEHSCHFHLVEAPNGRGASVTLLCNILKDFGVDETGIYIDKTISESVSNALNAARTNNQILVICGTFFIMAEVRTALGIIEPRDPIDLN